MRGAGDHFTVGDRIAFYRRRRGLTQRVLAQLVGRSEDWLSKVERNEREVRRLDVIGDVARALRVSVGDCSASRSWSRTPSPKNDDVPAIRDALMSHRRLSQTLFGARAVEAVAVEPVGGSPRTPGPTTSRADSVESSPPCRTSSRAPRP